MKTGGADLAKRIGLDGALRLKATFRDRYELRSYVRALLLAKRLLNDPQLVARGQAYLERFVRTDPRQRRIYELWAAALEGPLDELVADLIADDSRGALLRETAPVFVVIPADEVRGLIGFAA